LQRRKGLRKSKALTMVDLDLVGNEFICMSQIGDGTAKVEGVTFLVAQEKG
jgi:hypothetical protein